jgi:Na+-translocating ferredoxin:NAD+ oxidoreductase RNF subunit RnfB
VVIFLNILLSILVAGVLGALIGFGLGFSAKVFGGMRDEKTSELEKALPGYNCGACGYVDCSSYARALREGAVLPSFCGPGGEKIAKTLAKIMGVEVSFTKERKVAQVHCRGGIKTAEYLFDYRGLDDCTALYLLFGGDKACKASCLGQGSCLKICPVGAISYDGEGLVWVDKDLCVSCGKCIDICPTGVLRYIPRTADYLVACNSTDKAADVQKYCSVGCTGCRACEKRSPEGGFGVVNNLAHINYKRRGERYYAHLACPPKCIIANLRDTRSPAAPASDSDTNGQT